MLNRYVREVHLRTATRYIPTGQDLEEVELCLTAACHVWYLL